MIGANVDLNHRETGGKRVGGHEAHYHRQMNHINFSGRGFELDSKWIIDGNGHVRNGCLGTRAGSAEVGNKRLRREFPNDG